MNKKGIYILIVVVVVLLLILLISSLATPKTKPGEVPSEVPGQEEIVPAPEGGEVIPAPAEGEIVPAPESETVTEPEMIEAPLGEFNPENINQTPPLVEEQIPAAVIKIRATTTGFEPNEFSVKAGKPVSLAITGVDATHVFKFNDPSLSNVAVGVANGETRGISFVAPSQTGDYSFYCDVPGHQARGEAGVMHVTR